MIMFDSLNAYNYEDFRQRYRRSYGFLTINNNKRVVYVSEVSRDKVTFNTTGVEGCYAYAKGDVQFEFLPITRGWHYTSGYGPLLLQRIPERQWCRGISLNNTSVSKFSTRGELTRIDVNLSMFEDVFINKPEMPEADGFILNKYFLLSDTFKKVFFLGSPIGKFIKNKITLDDRQVSQELIDFIKRKNLDIVVQ